MYMPEFNEIKIDADRAFTGAQIIDLSLDLY